MRRLITRAVAITSTVLACSLAMPTGAHADYLTDYPAAVTETVHANVNAFVTNSVELATAPISCQIREKAGGPLINPGINTGVGVAVFPQDYASAGAQCFSFQELNYSMELRIELQRRLSNGIWMTFDFSQFAQDALEGVAVIPQQVLTHVYDQIPDPNIGTTGSVHRGRFVLTLSTGQVYASEFTPLPWTMAPW